MEDSEEEMDADEMREEEHEDKEECVTQKK